MKKQLEYKNYNEEEVKAMTKLYSKIHVCPACGEESLNSDTCKWCNEMEDDSE